ncbi:unnamed protein product [Mycena citricolor]|uniref:Uncharacterized protein n=1 Tax=Mycena citricolor TaxID=2018698 RepID=A0AAD2JVH1_9AGAR|nr:unnamed protein product [Mycena citricolor]
MYDPKSTPPHDEAKRGMGRTIQRRLSSLTPEDGRSSNLEKARQLQANVTSDASQDVRDMLGPAASNHRSHIENRRTASYISTLQDNRLTKEFQASFEKLSDEAKESARKLPPHRFLSRFALTARPAPARQCQNLLGQRIVDRSSASVFYRATSDIHPGAPVPISD